MKIVDKVVILRVIIYLGNRNEIIESEQIRGKQITFRKYFETFVATNMKDQMNNTGRMRFLCNSNYSPICIYAEIRSSIQESNFVLSGQLQTSVFIRVTLWLHRGIHIKFEKRTLFET